MFWLITLNDEIPYIIDSICLLSIKIFEVKSANRLSRGDARGSLCQYHERLANLQSGWDRLENGLGSPLEAYPHRTT